VRAVVSVLRRGLATCRHLMNAFPGRPILTVLLAVSVDRAVAVARVSQLKVSGLRVAPLAHLSISWSAVPVEERGEEDWVGVYSPHDTPSLPDGVHYLDFIRTAGHSHASAPLEIVGLGSSFSFRYHSVVNGTTKVLAESEPVVLEGDGCVPAQSHLALTGREGELRMMWTTREPGASATPAVIARRIVQDKDAFRPFGNASSAVVAEAHLALNNNEWGTSLGTSHTYSVADLCGAPANIVRADLFRSPGWIKDVKLTGLVPDAKYELLYGHGDCWGRTVVQAPPKVAPDGEFALIFYGDQGAPGLFPPNDIKGHRSPGARRVIDEVARRSQDGHVRLVHVMGDLTYGLGSEFRWDGWGQHVAKFAKHVPLMVGVGNHDYCVPGLPPSKDPSGVAEYYNPSWGNFNDWHLSSGGECGVPFSRRFHMPDNGNGNFWYSYDVGSVHVIAFSTENNLTRGSLQWDWLVNDLAAVDRARTPWIVATGHRPAYESEDYPSDTQVARHLRVDLDKLWAEHRVSLVMAGHYHAYTRTCPVINGVCRGTAKRPRGPVHLTVGTGGDTLDSARCRPFHWQESCMATYGFLQLFANPQELRVQFWGIGWQEDDEDADAREIWGAFELLDDVAIGPYQQTSLIHHRKTADIAPH